MLNRAVTYFLVLIASLLLWGVDVHAQKSKKELENERKFQSLFFDALTAKSLGNAPDAISAFKACLDINSKADAAWYELSRLQALSGNFTDGIFSIEKALDVNPKNPYYLELAAELHTGIGEYKKALNLFDEIIELKPKDPEAYLSKAEIYEALGDVAKTEKLYDKVIEITGESLNISYRKIQGLIRGGKVSKAIEETDNLIDQYPEISEIREMKAEFYLMQNKQKEAKEVLKTLLEINPHYENAALKMAQIEVASGNFVGAISYAKTAFKSPDIGIDDKMRLMLIFYESSNMDKTHVPSYLELAETLTMAHPRDGKSYAVYGDILLREQKIEDALAAYLMATTIAPDKRLIWERILEIESNLALVDSLAKHSKQCITLFPSQPVFYLFSGLAQMQQGNGEKALFDLESGLSLVVNAPGLKLQFLNLLGDVETELQHYSKADKYYDQALAIDPNNPLILNNFAYSLANRGQKLKDALQMIEKCNSISPDNPSFLDTYAWVLFKMKDYDKAQILIARALALDGEKNGVLLEHCGDILYFQDEKENALMYWKKAQGKEGVSDKLEKKIEKGTWVE